MMNIAWIIRPRITVNIYIDKGLNAENPVSAMETAISANTPIGARRMTQSVIRIMTLLSDSKKSNKTLPSGLMVVSAAPINNENTITGKI